MDKYLEICHLGEGESTLLFRTNVADLAPPKDNLNLWSICEIIDGKRRVSYVSCSKNFLYHSSAILMSLSGSSYLCMPHISSQVP